MTEITQEKHTLNRIPAVFAAQRAHQPLVAASNVGERMDKLRRLERAIHAHQTRLQQAMYDDFRKNPSEVDLTELLPVTSEIKYAIRHLRRWLRRQRAATPLTLIGTTSWVQHEAKGVCLIISPWNFPINLCLCPLVSAIAAGNCVILKPSEHAPHTAQAIANLIGEVFEPAEITVMQGEVELSTALLTLPFDHIFFTGAPEIGKVVMRAAAEHLTSVTLELGGKSPVVIDQSADLAIAARRIVFGKYVNCGQTCIAPDYVLVPRAMQQPFIEQLDKYISQAYGNDAAARKASESFPRMVNARHFERVSGYLQNAVAQGATVAIGGQYDATQNYIAPTVLTDVNETMQVMENEIFGPLLPIVPYDSVASAVQYINTYPKPLSLYVFSQNRRATDYVLANTSAGGGAVNDTAIHFFNANLPFGGVNNSGIGKCHGFYGFQAFSNPRGVTRQNFKISALQFLAPPYSPRVKRMIELVLKYF
jgi:aldehyde dehydrogenase (NAD+)